MTRTLALAAQPASSGHAPTLMSNSRVHAGVPSSLMRAPLAEPVINTAGWGEPSSGSVAAIGSTVEEPLETAARHDDPPAQAQRRKLPAGHELVGVCPRNAEGRCGLGHGQDEPVVTMHEVTWKNGASDEAVANDWRLKGPDATQVGASAGGRAERAPGV